jgi:hypothetical protein
MADANPPIVGNAAAFERSAKAILARAETALRQSVQTLAEVRGLASQIEAAGAASQGEAQAAEAINRKANAAERAAAAVALQNQRMREAASAARGEEAAAVALERKAAAAERAAAAMAEANAAGVTGSQRAALAEQRLAELKERNAEIERSTVARAAIVTGAQAQRQDARLGYQEQVPLRRQQGSEQARVAAEQARMERQAAANAETAARGYRALGPAAAESTRWMHESALAMTVNQERAEGLGRKLLSTAGEYGRFAVATGGLFAVVDVFKQVYEGATASQQGVQGLRRVLDDKTLAAGGGPAGAMRGFSQLSREMNVPIKDAAEATQLMARQFQSLPQALTAARVALGFTKLDAISAADSVRYLGAAAQAFRLPADQLERRIADPIEQVARRGGEPPAQILRAFAASSQIANAGGSPEQFAGLVGAAIRASAQTGNVIATAFQRSIANALPRGQAQATIRQLGLDPQQASSNYTQFLVNAIRRSRTLDNEQRRELAQAIGGKFYGSRVFEPLFERPEQSLHRVGLATSPQARGAFAQELHEQLKRVDERVHSIGNGFQRLGQQLAAAHILEPFNQLLTLITNLTDAVGGFVSAFNAIVPDRLKGVATTLAAILASYLAFTRFNVADRLARQTTETGVLGRFIGPGTRNRVAQQQVARLEEQQLAQDLAQARAGRTTAARRYNEATRIEAAGVQMGPFKSAADERTYTEAQAQRTRAVESARRRVVAANERVVALEATEVDLAQREVVTLEAVARARGQVNGAQGVVNATTAAGVGMGGSKGVIEASALGGLMSRLGPVAGTAARFVAPFIVIEAAGRIIEGGQETHGNFDERLAGSLRRLGGLSPQDLPITGSEQQKAGRRDAISYIRDLPYADRLANPAVARERLRALAERRAGYQRDLDREYYARGEPDQLKAARDALDREIRREAATAVQKQAQARIRRGGSPFDDYLKLSSEQLVNVATSATTPMVRTGDGRQFADAVRAADALSTLGHRQDRQDLLDKADQIIRANVSAVSQELQDNLALATSQADRDDAYRKAEAQAAQLEQSRSPEQRRQGRVLEEQIRQGTLSDYTARQDAKLGYAQAVDRDPAHGARMAVETAQREYEKTLRTYHGDRTATPVRQARNKLEQARNAADDAELQKHRAGHRQPAGRGDHCDRQGQRARHRPDRRAGEGAIGTSPRPDEGRPARKPAR